MPGEICDCTNDSEEDAAKVISTALLAMLGIGLAGVRVRRENTIDRLQRQRLTRSVSF